MEKVIPLAAITHAGQRGMLDTLRRPIHDLRISVMDRCNFRCPYCMPRETFHDSYRFLKSSERLDFAELLQLTRVFVRAGVKKIRITGGEPLLRPNLADFIGDLTSIAGIEDIALTTNGVLLSKYASELKAAGLDRITVSLDTLDTEVFAKMSGGFGGVAEVLEGIEHARRAGLAPIKINTVVQRGVNDHTVMDLLEHFRGSGVIVRFIEYMDVGTRNHWKPEMVMSSRDLAASIHARWPISARGREYPGEVAERYAYDDGGGEIGFISSVSQPFCGDCSRARISSDGSLYTCLFATEGTDLRAPLRAGASDDELFEIIRGVWSGRRDRYSELRASLRNSAADLHKVEMNYIGG
jgi:cyclic pyranopterin phosphate synthase